MTLRTMSNRAVTRDDVLHRMNHEILPVLRQLIAETERIQGPVRPQLSDRAVSEAELLDFAGGQLLPVLHSLGSQVNALSTALVVQPVGSRAPQSLDSLVVWLNRVVIPRVAQARSAIIAAG